MAKQKRDETGLARIGEPGVLVLLSALEAQLARWSRVVQAGRTRLATT